MDYDTPTFEKPPIVELVLGVQFSPLRQLQSGHYGRFWNALGGDWHRPKDNRLIADQFENFGRPPGMPQLQFQVEPGPPLNRLTLINQDRDRLVQFQPTRLHLNWRNQGASYPSYKALIVEFERTFAVLKDFCQSESIGTVDVNQWEITYVDKFPRGEYWETPDGWSQFLPGLFQLNEIPWDGTLELETRSVQWGFEIKPQLGRLHVQAALARGKTQPEDALMLNITARGPLREEHTATYRQGLDLGHKVAVDQFLRLVSQETRQRWGEKQET